MEFISFLLILLVPGVVGAVAYSIVYRLRTEVNPYVALVLNLLTFTTMITALCFFNDIKSMTELIRRFTCLGFTRNYILLSLWINIIYGVVVGLLRRMFFWIRR